MNIFGTVRKVVQLIFGTGANTTTLDPGAPASAITITLPVVTSTLTTLAGTETLTNKTLTSPAITTPTGIVKGDVGLGSVDNTSDADKPVSTATQTALNLKVNSSLLGATNGVATLDGGGLVPAGQLPSYVDDVLEYADLATLPVTGVTGKIYVALDTGKIYRWSGSVYIEISPSPGSTDAVPEGATNLYYTDVRAAAAAPVQSVSGRTGAVTLAKADVGLANVDNTSDVNKPISTATQTALNAKEPTVTAGTSAQYYRGDKTFQTLNTDIVPEGATNLYYTDARVTALVGTSGYKTNWTTGTSLVVTHNLGTLDVIVQLYDIASGDTIFVDSVVRTSTSVVTLTSPIVPPGSGFRVLVKTA